MRFGFAGPASAASLWCSSRLSHRQRSRHSRCAVRPTLHLKGGSCLSAEWTLSGRLVRARASGSSSVRTACERPAHVKAAGPRAFADSVARCLLALFGAVERLDWASGSDGVRPSHCLAVFARPASAMAALQEKHIELRGTIASSARERAKRVEIKPFVPPAGTDSIPAKGRLVLCSGALRLSVTVDRPTVLKLLQQVQVALRGPAWGARSAGRGSSSVVASDPTALAALASDAAGSRIRCMVVSPDPGSTVPGRVPSAPQVVVLPAGMRPQLCHGSGGPPSAGVSRVLDLAAVGERSRAVAVELLWPRAASEPARGTACWWAGHGP